MDIVREIEKIVAKHQNSCYSFDPSNMKLVCNEDCCPSCNPIFTEITGFLLKNEIKYKIDERYNIQIKM